MSKEILICGDGYEWEVIDRDDKYIYLHCSSTEDNIRITYSELKNFE